MKKLVLVFALAAGFAACNTNSEETADVATNDSTLVEGYTANEGDYKMEAGKVVVFQNGAWTPVEADVTLENGVILTPTGEIKNTDGTTTTLTEGGFLSKAGQALDATGAAISNVATDVVDGAKDAVNSTVEGAKDATNATVEGAKDAVNATKEGAKDAVNAVKDAGADAKDAFKKATK